jgi:hypothetical protein
MNTKPAIVSLFLLVVLAGCAAQEMMVAKPPPFPEGVLSARWGMPVERVKQAIEADGNRFFQDDTHKPPFALYATGTYMKAPATLSYFFTPKSGKLYRVDVTFGDTKIYESAKGYLVREFNDPTFSQTNTDHWSWPDTSLIILQKDSSQVQVSCSSGPFLKLNHEEGAGLTGR